MPFTAKAPAATAEPEDDSAVLAAMDVVSGLPLANNTGCVWSKNTVKVRLQRQCAWPGTKIVPVFGFKDR